LADIRRVHAQHRERYGAPRVHAELRAEGQTVSRKRLPPPGGNACCRLCTRDSGAAPAPGDRAGA
jgi:hypothetical protein